MSDWLAWQIVDSAFPTGTFAHSWGLEAAWQLGEVEDLAALRRFVDASVLQAGHASLPLVNAAYRVPADLAALDLVADRFLTNPVANRASRIQGRTLVATVARIWPSGAIDRVSAAALGGTAHVAPVSGAAFRAVGVPLPTLQRALLFGTARGVLSAAVRLGIAGSFEAQRLQLDCAGWLERVATQCRTLDVGDLEQTAPLLDLVQASHDRLYSRLFQS